VSHDDKKFTLKLAKEFFKSKGVSQRMVNKVTGKTVLLIGTIQMVTV
jgi:hypothetical protein